MKITQNIALLFKSDTNEKKKRKQIKTNSNNIFNSKGTSVPTENIIHRVTTVRIRKIGQMNKLKKNILVTTSTMIHNYIVINYHIYNTLLTILYIYQDIKI